MADLIQTVDPALETTASDIRVFGKWSGQEVQISDMSLEVNFLPLNFHFKYSSFLLGLYPWRKTTEVSSTFGRSLSSKTFSKGIVSDC
jgi:hypothetical protein